MHDRPPPRITVTVPGRGAAPQELLAVGPPAPRRPLPEVPERMRRAGGPALLVLAAVVGAGVVLATDEPEAASSPALERAAAVQRVSAQALAAAMPADGSAARFDVRVRVRPAGPAAVGAPNPAGQVSLLGLTLPGFELSVGESAAPRRIDVPAREPAEVVLAAQARVADCDLAGGHRGSLALRVLGARGVEGSLWVRTPAAVVRALQDLARRTCRG